MSRKRSVITLGTKIKILEQLDKGLKVVQVARLNSMSESTIKSIRKNEQAIRKSTIGGNLYLSKTSVVRNELIERTEKALIIWIEDQAQKRIPIGISDIRAKALKIHETIKEQCSSSTDPKKMSFSASRGWFEKFKHRYALYNLTAKSKGVPPYADTESAEDFTSKFLDLVSRQGYTPDQVFNADECFLTWKKITVDKNVSEDVKCPKEYVKVLLCYNASGDSRMKPLVVNKSENPRAFKNIDLKSLPVYWMANENVWVTASMFKEWFHNCFVPDVKSYLLSKNLPCKALLLVSEGQNHPQDLLDENVNVLFFPKNTNTLLQPLDQGIVSNFKTSYYKCTNDFILFQNESCDSAQFLNALKNFTILDCVNQVALSSYSIDKILINKCWKKLWPQVVENSDDDETGDQEILQNNTVSRETRQTPKSNPGDNQLQDLNDSDVMDFVNVEINEIDLVNMIDGKTNIKNSNPNRTFNSEDIKFGLEMGEKLGNYFLEHDPNGERAASFLRSLNKSLSKYKKLYKELKKVESGQKANDNNE